MLPPNSSISNSEAPASPRPFSARKLGRTAVYFLLFLALFEIATWAIFTKTRLAGSSLKRFFWYGTSYEAKLREMVYTPDLPKNSVLYAGWLGDGKLATLPADVDLTVYGMSFSGNLSAAIHELRPELKQRNVGGPGAPLNHTYAIYQVDKKLRKTRFGIIGVTSTAVQEVLLMNRGSLYADAAFPYFFPRFKVGPDGGVVRVADSLINSAAELRAAFDDPELWRRQLAVLAENDDAYHRFYFARDPLDASALGRFARRGVSKHHLKDYTGQILGPAGFNRDHEATQVFRALLRQMVRELRAENVQPIVALFSLQGHGNHLYSLVEDILREDSIPYINSYDYCRSDERDNFQPDLHFVHSCDLAFARRAGELIDAAAPKGPPRP
ncbi:MAG: hypothetical protein JWM82_4025 [Myxococcales bacterium]|nr:hypothetical protein [Myxococcales bacterium]